MSIVTLFLFLPFIVIGILLVYVFAKRQLAERARVRQEVADAEARMREYQVKQERERMLRENIQRFATGANVQGFRPSGFTGGPSAPRPTEDDGVVGPMVGAAAIGTDLAYYSRTSDEPANNSVIVGGGGTFDGGGASGSFDAPGTSEPYESGIVDTSPSTDSNE